MPSGRTSTGTLSRALPYVIQSARVVREFEGVMVKLSDRTNLAAGQGLDWNEMSMSALTAQGITETTELDNPQQLAQTLFTVTPVMVAVQTIITDRTVRRISPVVAGKIGVLAQNAMQRLKDERGITALDGATTSLSGAGTTLTSGIISAAGVRIRSNATEPAMGPMYFVGHGFQIKDIQDEVVAAVGTYGIQGGLTEETFRRGFSGSLFGVEVYEDGNISIDSSDDAKGGVFAREALVLVDGFGPTIKRQELIRYGGGAQELIMYDEFAWGERSAGNWLFEVYSDALAPTG